MVHSNLAILSPTPNRGLWSTHLHLQLFFNLLNYCLFALLLFRHLSGNPCSQCLDYIYSLARDFVESAKNYSKANIFLSTSTLVTVPPRNSPLALLQISVFCCVSWNSLPFCSSQDVCFCMTRIYLMQSTSQLLPPPEWDQPSVAEPSIHRDTVITCSSDYNRIS